jgi:hypothetical protein
MHLAVNYQHFDMIEIMFEMLDYKICKSMLEYKNKFKRTPREIAAILHRKNIVEIIDKFYKVNKEQ